MLTGFSSMVNSINLRDYPRDNTPVSWADYEQWRREVVFDALQGLRYGQSFCNRFDIADNILFYERDPEWADMYIRQHYLA
jgi:hypothetical protein